MNCRIGASMLSLEPGPTLVNMVTTGFGPGGPVKIDAYVTITFSNLSAKIWLTDNQGCQLF